MEGLKRFSAPENYIDSMLNKVFGDQDEEGKAAGKAAFFTLKRVMVARSSDELSDISLEQLISCFEIQPRFVEFFEDERAAHYEGLVKERIKNLQTQRKRRVL